MQSASVAPSKRNLLRLAGELCSEGQVIARSTAMREILDLVRKIAATNVPVLIQGEIGTGKQTIAREIHRQQPACRQAVGASRLRVAARVGFGGEAVRAFGWSRRRTAAPASLLESSEQSTLFLDGVAQLPLWAQVKLLDALQQGSGPEDGVDTRVRVIASSTCDLQTAVAEDCFYSGLYYYLNAVASTFHRCGIARKTSGHWQSTSWPEPPSRSAQPWTKVPRHFSAEAWQSLLQYDWPGNVLQLAAVVAHAAMLAEGPEIGQACFAGLLGTARQHADSETISVPLAGGLKDMELALINEVIRRCRGNKAAAARALKLHRRTLYRLLEE